MLVESQIAHLLGSIDADVVRRFRNLINAYGLPSGIPAGLDIPLFLESMKLDKKAVSGMLRFVLPDRIGSVSLCDNVPEAVIRQAVDHFLSA
jgi:3-dehydroquinate synthase